MVAGAGRLATMDEYIITAHQLSGYPLSYNIKRKWQEAPYIQTRSNYAEGTHTTLVNIDDY